MWYLAVLRGRWSALALTLSFAGCTAISDCKYEVGQKIRTSQAWHEFDGCNDECFTWDYQCGWKKGYYDVATGGDGTPPLFPPKKYWKAPVFVEHDPSRRDDWYAGYLDGAACAKSQPDHHFLPVYLPEQCMTSSSVPGSYLPAESIPFSPEAVPEGAVPMEQSHNPGLRAVPYGSSPPIDHSIPASTSPGAATRSYEENPEPAATHTAVPVPTSNHNSVVQTSYQGSLLGQLVEKAWADDENSESVD